MKSHPLPVMTTAEAFKQSNLPQTKVRTVSDAEIKMLEQNLRNLQPASNLTLPGQKFPKIAGGKRKRKKRRTRKK